ncbi:MAG: zinc ribbon domain-containing protein [Anaerolineae bacterium]|nr:zinc ribbon domain-containing protein [Anaerolineae bacterium]
MPIYEYQCQECGTPFELFVRSISKPVSVECPNCGSVDVRKGVSAFASKVVGGNGAVAASSAGCGPSL